MNIRRRTYLVGAAIFVALLCGVAGAQAAAVGSALAVVPKQNLRTSNNSREIATIGGTNGRRLIFGQVVSWISDLFDPEDGCASAIKIESKIGAEKAKVTALQSTVEDLEKRINAQRLVLEDFPEVCFDPSKAAVTTASVGGSVGVGECDRTPMSRWSNCLNSQNGACGNYEVVQKPADTSLRADEPDAFCQEQCTATEGCGFFKTVRRPIFMGFEDTARCTEAEDLMEHEWPINSVVKDADSPGSCWRYCQWHNLFHKNFPEFYEECNLISFDPYQRGGDESATKCRFYKNTCHAKEEQEEGYQTAMWRALGRRDTRMFYTGSKNFNDGLPRQTCLLWDHKGGCTTEKYSSVMSGDSFHTFSLVRSTITCPEEEFEREEAVMEDLANAVKKAQADLEAQESRLRKYEKDCNSNNCCRNVIPIIMAVIDELKGIVCTLVSIALTAGAFVLDKAIKAASGTMMIDAARPECKVTTFGSQAQLAKAAAGTEILLRRFMCAAEHSPLGPYVQQVPELAGICLGGEISLRLLMFQLQLSCGQFVGAIMSFLKPVIMCNLPLKTDGSMCRIDNCPF